MEVVGAAASIIAVVQITGTVISICYDYQSGIRHYPKDVVKITHELQDLRNVLERLADMANSLEDSTSKVLPTLDLLNQSGGPLETCKAELELLELKLTPPGGRLKQIRRALIWPLKEKDVQKTLDTLARQRGLFQLALTTDQTEMTVAIQQVASRTEEMMTALNERSQAVTIDRRNHQIVQWLAAPDPSSNHNKTCKIKQPGTGRWLLESSEYRKWKSQPASFLWLHGIPGCGKTVLCSTIIDHVASVCLVQSTHRLAYYYFDFNDTRKQTCEGLMRSLVTQFSGKSPESSETLEAMYSHFDEGKKQPTVESLAGALRGLVEHSDETYIVLDALDECAEIQEVISFLDDMRDSHFQNLHILITSRKETVIEKGLRDLITEQIPIQKALVDGDIGLLVRESLRSDRELSRWSETLKAEIEKTLYDGSQGMFRWAVCQLDALRKCIKPSALRKTLASLPKTLDDTYERILCNIDEDHAEDVLKVLQWLAFSVRPLNLREIAEATAITLDDTPRFDPGDRLRHPTDILAICSSLIYISTGCANLPAQSSSEGSPLPSSVPKLLSLDEDPHFTACRSDDHHCASFTISTEDSISNREVRLAHYSVKEYLVSERIKRAKAAFYSINEASTNVFLLRSCIVYLMHCGQPFTGSVAKYVPEYPLLRYSAQNWAIHATNLSLENLSYNIRMDPVLREPFLPENRRYWGRKAP